MKRCIAVAVVLLFAFATCLTYMHWQQGASTCVGICLPP